MAKTTNISFDKKKYYKVYYSNNKDYLRLKQRLRYYHNKPVYDAIIKSIEYLNPSIFKLLNKTKDRKLYNKPSNKNDNDSEYILCFE